MRMLLLAAAASLGLTGCQTVNQGIRDTLPEICTAATAGYAVFGVYASAGHVSSASARNVGLAWDVLQPLCVNPEEQNTATVIVAAAQALATISAAVAEAEEAP